MNLNDGEKDFLLTLARNKITSIVNHTVYNSPKFYSENLKKRYGVFVTLTKQGDLRGCIGYIKAVKPLQTAVEEMAVAAALEDPRFSPVDPSELPRLEIEISVLSPLKKIRNASEIEVGRHGIMISQGYYQGLLLPQVAVEYHWDRRTFLEETCRKAGLAPDAWREDTTDIEIFSAEIFSEPH